MPGRVAQTTIEVQLRVSDALSQEHTLVTPVDGIEVVYLSNRSRLPFE